jgi:HAD superfamily hydrolase (TIGR01509 family)
VASRKPTFILFDLGNVLVYIHPEAFLQTLGIDSPENRRSYQPLVIDIVKRYERGDDSTGKFLDRMDELFNSGRMQSGTGPGRGAGQFTREQFRHAMLRVVGKPVEGMEDLVRRVASKASVGLLSNTNPLHYEIGCANLRVLQFIPNHFLSYKLRALKPDPLIFERVLQQLSVDPAEILYIDDIEENLHAARPFGFACHLFRERLALESELARLGLV